jgi:hypothetical protein
VEDFAIQMTGMPGGRSLLLGVIVALAPIVGDRGQVARFRLMFSGVQQLLPTLATSHFLPLLLPLGAFLADARFKSALSALHWRFTLCCRELLPGEARLVKGRYAFVERARPEAACRFSSGQVGIDS